MSYLSAIKKNGKASKSKVAKKDQQTELERSSQVKTNRDHFCEDCECNPANGGSGVCKCVDND